jgi:serine/threonine-protein kinase RsbW
MRPSLQAPDPEQEQSAMQAERLDDSIFVISCEMDSTPADVTATLSGVNDLLKAQGVAVPEDSSWELVVAEVLNNIVEHAYQDQPGGRILMKLSFSPDALRAEFTDFGLSIPNGTPPDGVPANIDVSRDDLPEGGFGWFLIRSLAEDLSYRNDDAGNHLTLTVRLTTSDRQ